METVLYGDSVIWRENVQVRIMLEKELGWDA